jgi:hypothetical protein
MEKMLERAVLFAYRKATALGADSIEAFETALGVLHDARPDLEESEARSGIAILLETALADPSATTVEPVENRARF